MLSDFPQHAHSLGLFFLLLGFFFFSDKYKVQGGRPSKVNERIKAPKKTRQKEPGHDAHTVVCLSRDTNQV